MGNKKIWINSDLKELISYENLSMPFISSVDCFDDYFMNEWSCHWHNEFEFGIVMKGSVEYTIYNGQCATAVQTLNEGDGIFINANSLHSARGIGKGSKLASCVFPVTFFRPVPFRSSLLLFNKPQLSGLPLYKNNEADRGLLSAIKELCGISETETGYELHCIEIVCRICRLLTIRIHDEDLHAPENRSVQEQRTRDILSYIHDNYSRALNIGDIAKAVCISRTECFRSFRAVIGKTPAEYLTEYRLSKAAALLSDTDRTVSDICFSCGFNDPSYFSKVFREKSGLTPGIYRKKFRRYQPRSAPPPERSLTPI